MKPTDWIALLFLLFVFFTSSSKANAADNNGVAQRVATLEALVQALTTEVESNKVKIADLKYELDVTNAAIADLQHDIAGVKKNSVLDLDGILTYDTDDYHKRRK